MADIVTVTAVLIKGKEKDGKPLPDQLYVACSPDWGLRVLDCRPKDTPRRNPESQRPEWQYEERDGRLYLFPSLLCLDTKFHTDYNWDCAYEEIRGESAFHRFFELNPNCK